MPTGALIELSVGATGTAEGLGFKVEGLGKGGGLTLSMRTGSAIHRAPRPLPLGIGIAAQPSKMWFPKPNGPCLYAPIVRNIAFWVTPFVETSSRGLRRLPCQSGGGHSLNATLRSGFTSTLSPKS